MSHQLWYTSAERGLAAGTRGFCTVKATHGIPRPLAQKLESLSGYTHLFPPHDKGNPANPVAYHFVCVYQGGKKWYVLSRVCDAGLDYSGRSNKFAHHVVLDQHELPPAGPAWLMGQPGFFDKTWDGVVGVVDSRKSIPQSDSPPRPCIQWETVTGDAGWAGLLAESVLNEDGPPVHIIAPPNLSVLPLLEEAIALLPPELRWSATFSTYYTEQFPADVTVRWRVVLQGTREAVRASGIRHQLVIDLTKPGPIPTQVETPAITAARKGTFIRPPAAAVTESNRIAPAVSSPPSTPETFPPVPPAHTVRPPIMRAPIRPPERIYDGVPIGSSFPDGFETEKGRSMRNVILIMALPVFFLGMALGWSLQMIPDILARREVPSNSGAKKEVAIAQGTSHNKSEATQPSPNKRLESERSGALANSSGKQSPDTSPPSSASGSTSLAPATGKSSNTSSGKAEAGRNGHQTKENPNQQEQTHPQKSEVTPNAPQPQEGSLEVNSQDGSDSGQLDATGAPKWRIRSVSHSLSKWFKIGILEEAKDSEGVGEKEPASPPGSDIAEGLSKSEDWDLLIIDGKYIHCGSGRLSELKKWSVTLKEEAQPEGTIPGGKALFPLVVQVIPPSEELPLDSGRDVRATLSLKRLVVEMEFETKSGEKSSPQRFSELYESAPSGEILISEASGAKDLILRNKSTTPKLPGELKCNAKALVKEGKIEIQIDDPQISSRDGQLCKMEIKRIEGEVMIDIVLDELDRKPIRVIKQQLRFPFDNPGLGG